ncbi:MAG TPA: glycosyltransferase [Candidatus Limnocylindria bacterium]|nr:glycosyltransferase [Candidatus Limnocylindria bacterium]
MSLLLVVDYVANPGGGCRFVAEMVRSLRRVTTSEVEIVSHGASADRYRALLGGEIPVRDVRPLNALRVSPPWIGVPGARLLNALLGTPDFHFDVPAAALAGCDAVWFPWLHRHRVAGDVPDDTVATLHDCIVLEFPGIVPESARRDEAETTRRWLASSARVVFTSHATVAVADRLFGSSRSRPVIPLSAKHERPAQPSGRAWPFGERPYLLCPTNLSPHKNLETLLEGLAAWGAKVPLVVTGPGTDLRDEASPRQRQLRSVIAERGLVPGRDLFTLGYLEDSDYYALLEGAWALVIPTLDEGGGSFPVLEATERGIPVLSSDIPVMREMAERWNVRPIWFDARDATDLARKLAELEGGYDEHRQAAREQAPRLLQRSWDDVALEYATVMELNVRAAS